MRTTTASPPLIAATSTHTHAYTLLAMPPHPLGGSRADSVPCRLAHLHLRPSAGVKIPERSLVLKYLEQIASVYAVGWEPPAWLVDAPNVRPPPAIPDQIGGERVFPI